MAIDAAQFDHEVRAAIARLIREWGAVPRIADVATHLHADLAAVDASFARMIDAHVFIPRRDTHEIYAYNPICSERTDFHVRTAGRDMWGICGWDALGIPAALGSDGAVETPCADRCGESLLIDVRERGRVAGPTGTVLHVGVPAREFWKDIYFT